MKTKIYTALLVSITLASCTQQDDLLKPNSNTLKDAAVGITTSVSNMSTRTRNGANTAYQGKTLGLNLTTENSKYCYENIEWTANESGEWTPQQQMLWQSATTNYTLGNAYAPYSSELYKESGNTVGVYHKIKSNQAAADGSGITESDLVGYNFGDMGNQFTPAGKLVNGKLPITFDHKLSKLTVECVMGNQWDGTGVSVADVKVINTYTKVLYLFNTNTVADKEYSEIEPIAMRSLSSASQWEAIIAPLEVAAGIDLIEITLSNKAVYQYTTLGFSFAPGRAYSLRLRIGKDGLEVAQEVTVSEWDTTHQDSDISGGEAEALLTINATTVVTHDMLAAATVNGKLLLDGTSTNAQFAVVAAYVRTTPTVTHLDFSHLKGITKLGTIYFGEGAYDYDELTFTGSSLIEANLPTTITTISGAFYNCAKLTTVTGLDNVINDYSSFNNCTSLKDAPIMPCLKTLDNSFAYSGITSFINTSVEKLEAQVFAGCTSLKSVVCPAASYLRNDLFEGCTVLTNITLMSSSFTYVRSFISTLQKHYDPFTDIPTGQVTLHLNANQKEFITLPNAEEQTDCVWEPFGKGVTNESLKDPVILTHFKAIYCGEELVYEAQLP